MTTREINHTDTDSLTALFSNNLIEGWDGAMEQIYLSNDNTLTVNHDGPNDYAAAIKNVNVTDRRVVSVNVTIEDSEYPDTQDERYYTFWGVTEVPGQPIELLTIAEYNGSFSGNTGISLIITEGNSND